MSEEGKGSGIPAWQRSTASPAESKNHSTDGSDVAAKQEFEASKHTPHILQEPESPSDHRSDTDGSDIAATQEFDASTSMLDQVRKFLQDPAVKDAPTEKKRAFLRSKRVSPELIQQVLGEEPAQPDISVDEFRHSHTSPTLASEPPQPLPPIVTYPEFLIQPKDPPPLVTIDRLLNTAYFAGGLAAAMYGLSKFIITPMVANLTDARHDFASHTTSRLETMTERLSGLVSTQPSSLATKPDQNYSDDFDLDSPASDPTELFHRDIGTQTSFLDDETASIIPAAATAETTLSKQETRIKILKSHMSELLADSETNASTNEDVQDGVEGFRHYLDTLLYFPATNHYLPGGGDAGMSKDKKDDAVAAFKAEIRGVKGILLSAKRFPSAVAAR